MTTRLETNQALTQSSQLCMLAPWGRRGGPGAFRWPGYLKKCFFELFSIC